MRECRTLKGRCQVYKQDSCHRRATHERRSAVTLHCGPRSWGHLEASRAASVQAMVRCRRLATGWHSGHSPANTYERLGDARRGEHRDMLGRQMLWHGATSRRDPESRYGGSVSMPVQGGDSMQAPTQRHWRHGTEVVCCRRRSPVASRPRTRALRLRPPARRPAAGRRARTRSRRGCVCYHIYCGAGGL
jgi:hypothetical protein